MKKTLNLIVILLVFSLAGCSIPAAATYSQLYSFTQEEKKLKGGFGGKKKVTLIKDFRENEMYIEDISALKEDVEKYIEAHPELSDVAKNNLRELKVVPGNTEEEVELLLGQPDKISKSHHANSETWIYRINRLRTIIVFILPVFFVHEGYYLCFQDNRLLKIEKHYPKQIVHQASAPGLTPESKSK